ncbi:unnamed protein product, partial [marine sediment metagenome]
MAEQTSPLLSVRNLRKYFPVRRGVLRRAVAWVRAVDGIDFDILPGRTLGLVGESGCGKTTTGRLILRLIELDNGTIVFRGTDITSLSQSKLRPHRKHMQVVFQ